MEDFNPLLREVLRSHDLAGLRVGFPLKKWPSRKYCFSYRIVGGLPRISITRILEEFSGLFGIEFFHDLEWEETEELTFAPFVGLPRPGCLGQTVTTYRGNERIHARVSALPNASLGTWRHELVHALTPINHVRGRNSLMNAEKTEEDLTCVDRLLVNFFLGSPKAVPGVYLEDCL